MGSDPSEGMTCLHFVSHLNKYLEFLPSVHYDVEYILGSDEQEERWHRPWRAEYEF